MGGHSETVAFYIPARRAHQNLELGYTVPLTSDFLAHSVSRSEAAKLRPFSTACCFAYKKSIKNHRLMEHLD